MAAGWTLWHATRTPAGVAPPPLVSDIAPAAVMAAAFVDAAGRTRSLAEFSGKVVVLNFWATWCAPCREEMPVFDRVYGSWAGRGVQVVGLSGEAPELSQRFGQGLGIGYPLWTGGDRVQELSRRLGNRLAVLPHTVILSPTGAVLEQRVGPYTEEELNERLRNFVTKGS